MRDHEKLGPHSKLWDIIKNCGDYEISDGAQGAQFGLFIKTKLYKLEGNKSLVKE